MNPRPINIGYLVIGLVFVGLAGAWLLNETGVMDEDGLQWLLPAVLLGAGVVGIFGSLGNGIARRSRKRPEPQPTYSDPVPPVTDLTSDLDRKLAEHEATTIIDTEGTEK